MGLEDYFNKDNVWRYDEFTKLIDDTIRTMPDLPKQLAVILTWTDEEDASINANFKSSGGIFGVHSLKFMGKPFRLFFVAMNPDTDCSWEDFMTGLLKTRFSECFLFDSGKAVLRTIPWESLEEAEEKHLQQVRAFRAAMRKGE
jgi:hypothetical protein